MDKYIQQANDRYQRILEERLAAERRRQEIEREQTEELGRINETLKNL
jgi:hypothetical protein